MYRRKTEIIISNHTSTEEFKNLYLKQILKKGICLRSDTVYSRFWGKGGGSLAPTGARLGTALVPGWSRLFIKLDCVKGGPTMTP